MTLRPLMEFIQQVFKVMNDCQHLIFQVLTKRGARLESTWQHLTWTENIWMGVSVENAQVTQRIDSLRKVPAAVRFLSCEPLIGPLDKLNLKGIDWVIVGGESGVHPRPLQQEWVTSIRDQCEKHDVAFFFKQWGGRNKKAADTKKPPAANSMESITTPCQNPRNAGRGNYLPDPKLSIRVSVSKMTC